MSPMFNACMQMNAGTPGPPPNIGSQIPNPNININGPGNLPNNNSLNEPPGFYNQSPHFSNQAPPPHPNFNNQIPRNIQTRPPNYSCPPIYEFKIYELTKRLSERPDNADNPWWDGFVSEFFDDRSTLTINVQEDGCAPKPHTIGRTLIPRYFRTLFDEGVQDFLIRLKRPFVKELPNRTATLECDHCTLITQHGKPSYKPQLMHYPGMDPLMMKENKEIGLVVTTEGRLTIEFVQDHDSIRIKTWNFTPVHFQEFILKNIIAMHTQQLQQHNPQQQEQINILDQLSKNVTRHGFTNSTMNHLSLFVLLEPMQLIMSRHKEMESSSPRDCLKNVLYNKWQTNVCAPQEQQRPANKRRKRKSSTPNNNSTGGGKKKGGANSNNTQLSPGNPNFPLATQDVMVVGEPSLMGGEFGDEDERVITRLENNQYDSSAVPTNGLDETDDFSAALSGNPSNQAPLQPVNQQQPAPQQQLNQGPPQPINQQQQGPPTPQQQQINQSPSQQQPGNNQLNNSNQVQNQWPSSQLNQSNGSVNSNDNNGVPNISSIGPGPQSIEDKKPSPISQ